MIGLFWQVATENNSISCPVEVEDNPLVKRRGRTRSKPCQRSKRQEVEVERDIIILKNPNSFINDPIKEQNLFPLDVIKWFSNAGGDNSLKVIISTLDPKMSVPGREKRGYLEEN